MTTVDKDFADNVIKNNGYFNGNSDNSMGDNPRIKMIVEYDNAWGGKGYGLVFDVKKNKYTPTNYVRNPKPYWLYQE